MARAFPHHQVPASLAWFKRILRSPGALLPDDSAGRLKAARDSLNRQALDQEFELFAIRIPVDELPTDQLPALYFTSQGDFPVVVAGREGDQFTLRLWDDRESVCGSGILKKTLQSEGFLFREKREQIGLSQRISRLGLRIIGEKRHLGLGIACGFISCSVLFLLSFLLHVQLDSNFGGPEAGSSWLLGLGLFAAVLTSFGFLQLRGWITGFFESRSAQIRSRSQQLPETRLFRSVFSVKSGRGLVESLFLPLLAAVVLFLLNDASWSVAISLLIPVGFFAAELPGLVAKWRSVIALCLPNDGKLKLQPKDRVEEKRRHLEPALDSAIRVHNLCLNHPDEVSRPIIDHLSFHIRKGEKVGLLGESAASNAILLRVLTGSIKADRGVIWMDGSLFLGENEVREKSVGWFSERTTLIEGTLEENICLDQQCPATREQLDSVLRRIGIGAEGAFREGLSSAIAENGKGLSRREKIQVLLARCLVYEPSILIIEAPQDEEVDAVFQTSLEGLLKDEDLTLLLASCRGGQIAALTRRAMFFRNGKITRDGDTSRVLEDIENEMRRRMKG